jgi:hypothetical protein
MLKCCLDLLHDEFVNMKITMRFLFEIKQQRTRGGTLRDNNITFSSSLLTHGNNKR